LGFACSHTAYIIGKIYGSTVLCITCKFSSILPSKSDAVTIG